MLTKTLLAGTVAMAGLLGGTGDVDTKKSDTKNTVSKAVVAQHPQIWGPYTGTNIDPFNPWTQTRQLIPIYKPWTDLTLKISPSFNSGDYASNTYANVALYHTDFTGNDNFIAQKSFRVNSSKTDYYWEIPYSNRFPHEEGSFYVKVTSNTFGHPVNIDVKGCTDDYYDDECMDLLEN
ncbi:hypothetical protein IC619_011695 [Hazenella sp. IB182353]|uniref:hypothetical protein n=1 Tax=Polycladospora coralii TaxID=2771432 RepID=UPI001745F023|nr:hypothetical protein [Polycladospora coralii]MBS7531159.1 hypothetical protein [Polycladospora coralii]